MAREFIGRIFDAIRSALAPQIAQLRQRIDPVIAQARSRYDKLETRERILVQIAGGLLALLIAYNFIYSPIVDFGGGLDARIAERERDLASVQRLTANYAMLRNDLNVAEHSTLRQSKDFSLFSVVEASFTKSVGRDRIASITPAADKKLADGLVQYSVQLKLNGVNLAQIVDALYAVRTLPVPVGVENIRIQRRTQDTRAYDVDLTCVALGRNG